MWKKGFKIRNFLWNYVKWQLNIVSLSYSWCYFTELSQQTGDLSTTLERQKEETQQELDTCARLIAEAYDKWVIYNHKCYVITNKNGNLGHSKK